MTSIALPSVSKNHKTTSGLTNHTFTSDLNQN